MGLAVICCGIVGFAARFSELPARLDQRFAQAATALIKFYQRHLSKHTGRVCLFEPSCSNRALTLLDQYGWREGIKLVDAQLKRCSGNYSLCTTCFGDVLLTTADGSRFHAEEVSPAIRFSASASRTPVPQGS